MELERRELKDMRWRKPKPTVVLVPREGTPPNVWVWKGPDGIARTFNGTAPVNRTRWSQGLAPHWNTLILDDDERRRRRGRWHPPGGAYRFLG
jgi:hypothetical protein